MSTIVHCIEGQRMAARKVTRTPAPKRRLSEAQIAVRLPMDLLIRLDEEVARLQAERPGLDITRSDAVREILFAHLVPHGHVATTRARG
jgi:hypothetical protein